MCFVKYLYSESLFNTLYIEIKTNARKITFRQNERYKKCSPFFARALQLITVLLLIIGSYMSWSTRFIYLKARVGFSIFNSVSIFLNFIFLFNKKQGLFDFRQKGLPSSFFSLYFLGTWELAPKTFWLWVSTPLPHLCKMS